MTVNIHNIEEEGFEMEGLSGDKESGDGGGPANDGIAFIFALDSPGKYLSSKSARSEILVSLVVGL